LKTPISGGITYKYQQYSLVRPQAEEEKKALMNQLVSVFGEGIKDGPKGGQLPLEGSAALLYSFLGKGWKPTNSK